MSIAPQNLTIADGYRLRCSECVMTKYWVGGLGSLLMTALMYALVTLAIGISSQSHLRSGAPTVHSTSAASLAK